MPQFVLLLHECPDAYPRPTHYDLMLEVGDALQTWALSELPCDWQALAGSAQPLQISFTNVCSAEKLADHRLAYLDYEGPVRGDRGTVRRLDAGTYISRTPLAYDLAGQKIRGQIELQQLPATDQWQLTFTPAQS